MANRTQNLEKDLLIFSSVPVIFSSVCAGILYFKVCIQSSKRTVNYKNEAKRQSHKIVAPEKCARGKHIP
jgi:hypothetical protein